MDESLFIEVSSMVPGGKKNLGKLGLSKEDIRKYILKSLRASCRLIRDYAKKHHRYEDGPARQAAQGHIGLTRAIHYQVLGSIKRKTQNLVGEVYVDQEEAPYAKYQIYGTEDRAPIMPKRSPFLMWTDYRTGQFFKRKWVRGIPKDDFIHKAYHHNRSAVRSIFRDYLRRLIDGNL